MSPIPARRGMDAPFSIRCALQRPTKNQNFAVPMLNAISTTNLTVTYGSVRALWNVSAEIPAGQLCGIIGPNGAGKSTLLKAMLGIIPTRSGCVDVQGGQRASDAIAYVPQRNTVDWDFPTTVFDLVMMGTYGRLRWFQRPGRRQREETRAALRIVQMEEFGNRQIGELSGGQQQRVFLARAFVQQAAVYLLDEPFAGIDAKTETLIMDILRQRRDAGDTIVLVHHDLTTVRSYFDHVVLLNRSLVGCGPTAQIFTDENVQCAYGVSGQTLLERA